MSKIPVGDVRPSQLLWTYGPGALVDLPNLSVLTMGLDRWDEQRCLPIEEARLLDAVKRVLGNQVERLRMPPLKPDENVDRFSDEGQNRRSGAAIPSLATLRALRHARGVRLRLVRDKGEPVSPGRNALHP
jgi:hypothetical protein